MAKKDEMIIEVKPLDIRETPIRIVGDTPLIVHAWGWKAKQMMLDAQMGKTKTKAKLGLFRQASCVGLRSCKFWCRKVGRGRLGEARFVAFRFCVACLCLAGKLSLGLLWLRRARKGELWQGMAGLARSVKVSLSEVSLGAFGYVKAG